MARTKQTARKSTSAAFPYPAPKRIKFDTTDVDSRPKFADGLFDESTTSKLHDDYVASSPFKHVVVDALFQDELLRSVKDEILQNIRFTEKETDIYKVHQTGDLASLSYLTSEQSALFPSLTALRDALYGSHFRTFVRKVTGCGHLSGSKQDMSINSYKKGCHLLNHDDVIGSRRVSYILYLPLPVGEPWQSTFGGALELYPTVKNADGILEPLPAPSKIIPPSWNQFIFFEVQPGKSFHSVEEVVVEPGEDGMKQRLSISGWFHKPQRGEEGYEAEDRNRDKSSLEQLSLSSTPLTPYQDAQSMESEAATLTVEQVAFLSDYLNPVYLKTDNLKVLAKRFAKESSIELHLFLHDSLAKELEAHIRSQDEADGYASGSRNGCVPSHDSGIGDSWTVKGPPHKLRYCVLSLSSDRLTEMLKTLQDDLFPSPAFRSWLRILSSLIPTKYGVEARRFRPGMDYTLARSERSDQRLDVMLGLTPPVTLPGDEGGNGWETGTWGGWECYMAPHDGEEDPAVYRSGRNGDDEEEEDGTLLVSQPGFNRLLVVLRDTGVLSFVKYVSAEAQGSRWDVCGEWEVKDDGQPSNGEDEDDTDGSDSD